VSGPDPVAVHRHAVGADPGLERCPIMGTYGPPSVTFVRGEGSWLVDREGRRYLDLLSGLAVTSLGHAHPEVAEAISEQSRTLLHVSNLFATEHAPVVAGQLDELLGGGGQVFFCNSGAEAVECALKLARRWGPAAAGRFAVVSALGSFHGRTLAALAATGQPAKHEPFQPLPEGFRHVSFDDVAALDAAVTTDVAAVLLEAVQGEGGVQPASVEYLRAAREICTERGVLLMIDEVQTGLGRCGDWFAHQAAGIRPDVVSMAKALGNGVPIGACWATAEAAASFRPGDHATTYGGQPLATAAARRVLEVMRREDVPALARRAGARFASGLEGEPGVVGVRGRGLLLAVELEVPAAEVAADLLAAGVVVNAVTPTAIRLAPSLLVTDDEVDLGVSALLASIARVAERTGESN